MTALQVLPKCPRARQGQAAYRGLSTRGRLMGEANPSLSTRECSLPRTNVLLSGGDARAVVPCSVDL